MLVLLAVLCAAPQPVGPVPAGVRRALSLAPHYTKHLDAQGLPIVSSRKVTDAALREAGAIVSAMLINRPDVVAALSASKVRLAVMAPTEFTVDLPEHADLSPASYWNRRARGLGATAQRPAVSCAEENLLDEPGDPYAGESICVHEFAHTIHTIALARLDPSFDERLRQAFGRAEANGIWRGTYAMSNAGEYWAEGVQSWFDTNLHDDSQHGAIDTREEVQALDPELASLIVEVFGEVTWRYQRPGQRTPEARESLGLPARLPRFSWPRALEQPVSRDAPPPVPRALRLETRARPPAKSPGTLVPATVIVTNLGREPITWDWVGFDGKLVRYATIEGGSSLTQETWLEHVWIISRKGEQLGWFSTPEGTSTLGVK